MVVYADILICLNTVVNYLILSVTTKICRISAKNSRTVLGAFVGALFSLYIFLPPSGPLVESSVRFIFSALIVVVAFGCKKIKSFIKQIIVFYCVTFVYAGLMLALWYIAEPSGMVINNGVVYFSISPIILISFSLLAYGAMLLFDKIHKTSADKLTCNIEITCADKTITATALVDSGHLLKDAMTDSDVVIVDKAIGDKLFGHITVNTPLYSMSNSANAHNFRVIPYKTISGEGIMPAFRCEGVRVFVKDAVIIKTDVIIGVISKNLSDDYSAIISPTLISE